MTIPAGALVGIPNSAIHRDEDNVNGRNARRKVPTGKNGCIHQQFVFGMLKESNGRVVRPSGRWDSLRKLILCILSIPAFVYDV
jgi:hypothetical protein